MGRRKTSTRIIFRVPIEEKERLFRRYHNVSAFIRNSIKKELENDEFFVY